MPKKQKRKHATKMTTNEAVKHLFHPDVVKQAKKRAPVGSKTEKKKRLASLGKPAPRHLVSGK